MNDPLNNQGTKTRLDYLYDILGDELDQFINSPPPHQAIRINTLKTSVHQFKKKLKEYNVKTKPHPINPSGFILLTDPLPLSHTLSFFKGHFQYQSASSQLPVVALNPQPNETILDMTSSPGSKSTQIAAAMKNTGRLFLAELSQNRMQSLLTNLDRSGVMNALVLNIMSQRFGNLLPEYFDRVLLDAPCTNLAKNWHHFIQNRRSLTPGVIAKHADIQYHLLVSAFKTVKIGGVVVYSTCSMAVEENELLIHKVLEKYKNYIEIDNIEFPRNSIIRSAKTVYKNKRFPELGKAVRIFPFPEPNESFFLVRIRKKKSFAQREDKRFSFSIKLDTWSSPNIQPVLHNLYKNWGVNPSVFRNKKFHLTQKKLWLINPAWNEIPAEGLVKIGLALAEKKSMGWKLTNAGTQLLNKRITKRIIDLEKDQLLKLFSNIPFSVKGLEQGYYILALDEQRIATVSHFKDILKTRLPHKFNLVFSF